MIQWCLPGVHIHAAGGADEGVRLFVCGVQDVGGDLREERQGQEGAAAQDRRQAPG